MGPHKQALVSSRLGKRLRALGCPSYDAYLDLLLRETAGDEIVQLLDAISTNVTSFYREKVHFDVVSEYVARWRRAGAQRMRMWSAACSSGEEPYTLAMTVSEIEGMDGVDWRILATDLSTRMLARAAEGVYESRRLDPVDPGLRARYFHRLASDQWQIEPQLRRRILFRRMNLKETPYPLRGPLDIIFCRNVMIYFDDAMRMQVLREFERLLKPGGLLLVGHAESLAGHHVAGLRNLRPSIYEKAA